MSDVLLVQNTKVEGSGYLGELLQNDGFDVTSVNAKYESLPDGKFSLVVILGAPESANDDLAYLRDEQQLIRNSVKDDVPVLGICLGSQLIAKTFGASVPFMRPVDLSDDYCGINDVLSHAVSLLENKMDEINYVCCIYPTSVFIQKDELTQGFKQIRSGNWSYVFSATNYVYPIFRSFEQNEDGGVKMFFPEYYDSRSQDMPIAYHDAAQFYWAKPSTWKNKKKIFNQSSYPILIPNWRIQDIDDEEDFKRAELLFKMIWEMNNEIKK